MSGVLASPSESVTVRVKVRTVGVVGAVKVVTLTFGVKLTVVPSTCAQP